MANKRKRTKNKTGLTPCGNGAQWQSACMNSDYEALYTMWLASLAQMRYKWLNLPESCDSRYLEQELLYRGIATIAFPEGNQAAIYSIGIVPKSASFNAYGDYVAWDAIGYNQSPRFKVTGGENGVLVRNADSFLDIWQGIQIIASQMARVKRTLDVNLQLQNTPWAITAPKEKQLEAINAYKQIAGYEPAVLATPDFWENVQFGSISTQTQYIGAELEATINNLWHEGLSLLGIENLQHEKRAQMTKEETEGDNTQTTLRLLDGLEPRREAADKLNAILGTDVKVVFNEDLPSEIYRLEQLRGFQGVNDNEPMA